MNRKDVFIVDAVRTAVGKFGGSLATIRPDDLASHVIKSILKRNPSFDPEMLEDLVFGAANQAGEDNRNVARMAALMAGLPIHVGGTTVNRLCASGLQAIMDASRAIMLGDGAAFISGGTESMSRAPFVMAKQEKAYGRQTEVYDTTIGWRFTNPVLAKMHYPFGMGETAENVAEDYNVSRDEQDRFSRETQLKYQNAHKSGAFDSQITAINIKRRKQEDLIFDKDEHPRLSTLEQLANLKPAFRENGSVTAGNSSGINDGAAALLLMDGDTMKRFGLKAMARIVSMAVVGVRPSHMGMGPVPATRKALERAGLTVENLDLIELNEAFASQSIACMRELKLDPEKVNVNGGSIAIGHPLGCSGARISTTLLHEMKARENVRYGLATMCVGVGQGAAIIYEKV